VDPVQERLIDALAECWRVGVATIDYVPEGGGSHHWRVRDHEDRLHFVTVDDLDNKQWLGDTRDAVFEGLRRALNTAETLRRVAGLDFVVAPVAGRNGEVVYRLCNRFAVSVFPFLVGRSHPFGVYPDLGLADRAMDMIVRLHLSTPVVREGAPGHVPGYTGRGDLRAFLGDCESPWSGGPFSESARLAFAGHVAELAELTAGFDDLVATTSVARATTVITHGEPHPANLMSVEGRVVLIDWDTVALAPPERDICLVAQTPGPGFERYEQATGHEVNLSVVSLYRLRWYLDDLACAVRMFRHPHQADADTRRWWDGLSPRLDQLPQWLALLG
jgi:spectinomycin phosphotransferase